MSAGKSLRPGSNSQVGSPLCHDATTAFGVGARASPGSDCSEVLAMGIRSVALD
jgi:hypothetical protein